MKKTKNHAGAAVIPTSLSGVIRMENHGLDAKIAASFFPGLTFQSKNQIHLFGFVNGF